MTADPRLTINYCPRCGSDDLAMRVPRRDDKERTTCARCGYVHYVGPALAAGVILRREGRTCLVRRAHEPGQGKWTFPGGFVDLDEDPEQAARREAREETGYRAEIHEFLGAYRSEGPRGKQVVILVYVGDASGEPDDGCWEVDEVRWFTTDELPWGEFAFPSTEAALRGYLDPGRRKT